MKRSFLVLTLSLCIGSTSLVNAKVRLPEFFGSGMIIQREQPVKIWGWADKNERIDLTFNGQSRTTRANNKGVWELTLSPMTTGGPHTMVVGGKQNKIEYDDILVGDVWLCSGQSNMEFSVAQTANADKEIASANYPKIRALNTPKQLSWRQADDVKGTWEVCSPETVGHFSAVAYYYARELHQELGVPIGIINSSWGGTAIEGWISSESYLSLPQQVQKEFNTKTIASVEEYSATHPEGLDEYTEYALKDKGLVDRWYDSGSDDSSWKEVRIPEQSGDVFAAIDGMVWFRYSVDLPATDAGRAAMLNLGRIDDMDVAWVNGVEVGRKNGHTFERKYAVPNGVLKQGQNTICVRITDELGPGGFIDRADNIYLKIGDRKVNLSGVWRYCTSVVGNDYYSANLSPNSIYSMLYNGMISPFTKFGIKGAIWYQGESNADRPTAYKTLFTNMITDWRSRWGYEFPFYWVQLANFTAKDAQPTDSGWAELREAQNAALSLPQTGEAVIIDIGDATDIHPINKQDVGRRLARIAFNKTYDKSDVVYSGPTFNKMEKQGSKLIITMDLHGSELKIDNKYGYIEGFAIAASDGKFVWAKAHLQADKIVVYSDSVEDPTAVRFAWGNNPDVNMYNTEGLPAVPFRTDK